MSVKRPLSHVQTGKPGRPKNVRQLAIQLIGSAGVAALEKADVHPVPGDAIRRLSLFVGELPPDPPTPKT